MTIPTGHHRRRIDYGLHQPEWLTNCLWNRPLHATDADSDTLTWSISSGASNGAPAPAGAGNSVEVGYTPNTDYTGTDSFVVQVDDGNSGASHHRECGYSSS